ncbi:MAG: oligosaccharide flippase family protein [Desulfobacterales bacterium]|nr:oligosaccharide flippase family protein [Desulfobacterales bacterium]
MNISKILDFIRNPQEHSLKLQSMRSAFYSIVGRGTGHFLRMAGSLILTRLLFPEAFGLMTTVSVILAMVQLFSDTGVRTSIIQNPKGGEPNFLNTAFIISVARGFLLAVIIVSISLPISLYYGKSDLNRLLLVMAINPLLVSFENPAMSLFIKKFRIERQVFFEITIQFLGLITSIALAWILRSVYALAWGAVLASAYRVAGSYYIHPFRPSLLWDKEAGRELFGFGKFIFLNTMITWATMNIDVLLIGKLLNMENLGYYNLGKNFADLIPTFGLQIIGQAFFPAISSIAGDIPRVMRIYRRFTAFAMAVAIFSGAALALFSNEIISLLYDMRYLNAKIPMFWLSVAVPFRLMSIITGTTFIAIGRPGLETISMAAGLISMAIFIPVGIKIGGLAGASIGTAGAVALTAITESLCLWIVLKFSFVITLRPWLQGALSVSLIIVIYILIKPLFSNIYFLITVLITAITASGGFYLLFEGLKPFKDETKKD